MPLFFILWLSYWLSIGYIFNFLNFVYLYAVRGSQTMLVQFGSLITQGAGKLGGHVVQRGSFGQTMRTKTSPVVRRSDTNQEPRAVQSHVASYWRDLASVDKTSWSSLASVQTRYNKFGTAYTPSGFQLFMELNCNRVYYFSQTVLEPAPAAPNFPNLTAWSLTADPSAPSLLLEWSVVGGDPNFAVCPKFYKLQSRGASFPRGSSLYTFEPATIGVESIDLQTAFAKRFGVVPGGEWQVAIDVFIIDGDTGFASPSLSIMVPYST
jgi:hypothetical protein